MRLGILVWGLQNKDYENLAIKKYLNLGRFSLTPKSIKCMICGHQNEYNSDEINCSTLLLCRLLLCTNWQVKTLDNDLIQ